MTNHTLQKQMIQTGAMLACVAIALGAFGAHQLKGVINEPSLATFETGVRYMFYHALAIFALGGSLRKLHEKTAKQVFQLFLGGVIIFTGSLFVLATSSLTFGEDLNWVGGLTPVGGAAFIGGWFLLAFKGYKSGDGSEHSRHQRHHRVKTDSEKKEI